MATQRLHKVIHLKDDFSHYAKLVQDGKNLDHIDNAVDLVNTKWPDYDEICVETFGFDVHTSDNLADHPHMVVLRGHVNCCCGGPCNYPKDHDLTNGGGFSKVVKNFVSMHNRGLASHLPHAPGTDYCEAYLDLNVTGPLLEEANQSVGNPTKRAALAANYKAEADDFELTAEDIESQLGILGADKLGQLSAPGAVAAVLAGTSTTASDYFWTALFIVLWEKFLIASYTKLSKDWPQRTRHRSIMLGMAPMVSPASGAAPAPVLPTSSPTPSA